MNGGFITRFSYRQQKIQLPIGNNQKAKAAHCDYKFSIHQFNVKYLLDVKEYELL